jgi:Ser/Thr protein kinase RdoA (MazF antagonist)
MRTMEEQQGGDSLSDEELRKLLKPAPSNDEIIALIQSTYARSGDTVEIIKELESYDDRNYWMKIDGMEYLVKVHNGVESLDLCKALETPGHGAVIQFQYEIMLALFQHGMSPRPVFSPNEADAEEQRKPIIKSLAVVSEAHSPCKLAISVFTWIPGVTISSLKMLPIECLASAGRFLGKMRSILDNLSADSLTASRRYHQVCPLRSRHQRIHHPCCPENLWCCFEPLLTFFRH